MDPCPRGMGGPQRVPSRGRGARTVSAVLSAPGRQAPLSSGDRAAPPRGHLPANHDLPVGAQGARRRVLVVRAEKLPGGAVRRSAPRAVSAPGTCGHRAGGSGSRRRGVDGRPVYPAGRVRRGQGAVRRRVVVRGRGRLKGAGLGPPAGRRLHAVPAGSGRRAGLALGHHHDPGSPSSVALRARDGSHAPRHARIGAGQLGAVFRSRLHHGLPEPGSRPADRGTAGPAAGSVDPPAPARPAGVAARRRPVSASAACDPGVADADVSHALGKLALGQPHRAAVGRGAIGAGPAAGSVAYPPFLLSRDAHAAGGRGGRLRVAVPLGSR